MAALFRSILNAEFRFSYPYIPFIADVVEHTQHRPMKNVFTKLNQSEIFPLNQSNRHHWHKDMKKLDDSPVQLGQ